MSLGKDLTGSSQGLNEVFVDNTQSGVTQSKKTGQTTGRNYIELKKGSETVRMYEKSEWAQVSPLTRCIAWCAGATVDKTINGKEYIIVKGKRDETGIDNAIKSFFNQGTKIRSVTTQERNDLNDGNKQGVRIPNHMPTGCSTEWDTLNPTISNTDLTKMLKDLEQEPKKSLNVSDFVRGAEWTTESTTTPKGRERQASIKDCGDRANKFLEKFNKKFPAVDLSKDGALSQDDAKLALGFILKQDRAWNGSDSVTRMGSLVTSKGGLDSQAQRVFLTLMDRAGFERPTGFGKNSHPPISK